MKLDFTWLPSINWCCWFVSLLHSSLYIIIGLSTLYQDIQIPVFWLLMFCFGILAVNTITIWSNTSVSHFDWFLSMVCVKCSFLIYFYPVKDPLCLWTMIILLFIFVWYTFQKWGHPITLVLAMFDNNWYSVTIGGNNFVLFVHWKLVIDYYLNVLCYFWISFEC